MSNVQRGRKVLQDLLGQGEKITKSKIAKLAGFAKSNLSPDRNGKYKNAAWESLVEDIKKRMDKPSQAPVRDKYKEARAARDDFKRRYEAQVKENAELLSLKVEWEHEKNYYKNTRDSLVTENYELKKQLMVYQSAFEQQAIQGVHKTEVATLCCKVISPDAEMLRITGGKYAYHDTRIQRMAHRDAQAKLASVLTANVPTRLYVMIGRPSSGKTRWVENHSPPHDRLAVYYDATNADAGERMDILDIAKANKNCIVCFVYMDTPVKTCLQRNENRPEKGITGDIITAYNIEPPLWDEGYDELIIERC